VKTGAGTVLGTCTTDSTGKCCVCVSADGTYTVLISDGTATYSLTAVVSGGAAETDVPFKFPSARPTVNVNLLRCGANCGCVVSGDPIAGVTPTNSGTTLSYHFSGATGPIPVPLVFHVQYTDCPPDYATLSATLTPGGPNTVGTVDATNLCSSTTTYSFDISGGKVPVCVTTCGNTGEAGTTVSTAAGTWTTDSTGCVTISGPFNTLVGNITVSRPRFTTYVYNDPTLKYGCCNGASVTLTPTSAYVCGCKTCSDACPDCADPLDKSLSFSGACGTATATHDASGGCTWDWCFPTAAGSGVPWCTVRLTTVAYGSPVVSYWRVITGYGATSSGPPCSPITGACNTGTSNGNTTDFPMDCTFPLVISGTIPGDSSGCTNPAAGGFTISEV
jgi:hypothetical protein